ncbi:anthrax toxin lethal factor-related metalloendopeptidase [Paenibacillus swuensis]|uniref:anthrax toxin lethal factor-related metalloendopeptidase n=1 Tax=Paenibacillus swuensis TaxID=1178515 RepID=UPI0008394742|nr:S-layer homology domain-containing protein [Paenibacillus swuensis]
MKWLIAWKPIIVALLLAITLCAAPVNTKAAISSTYLQEQLIIRPQGSYDAEEADAMVGRVFQLYPNLIEGLIYNDVHIKLTKGKITDEPEMAKYRGVIPRGWENTGKTWDDIPGSSGSTVVARIGYSERGKGHDTENLELHETFHAVDTYLFDDISQSERFRKLWREEAGNYFWGDRYMDTYSEEYFAEVSCMMFATEASRTIVETKLPETYSFLESLFRGYEPALSKPLPEIQNHWARKPLVRLLGLNILAGMPNGSIQADRPVTREQFIKLLMLARGQENTRTTMNGSASEALELPFHDVLKQRWSYSYLHSAVTEGIVTTKQTSGGLFGPEEILTRIEMAVWAAKALGLTEDDSALVQFTDVDSIAYEHWGWAGAAVKAGLMSGLAGDQFGPGGKVSRAQAAVVTAKVLDWKAISGDDERVKE